MKRVIFIFFLLFTYLSFAQGVEYEHKGKMGYLVDGLDDVKYKDTRLAFELWVQELANNEKIDTDIEYYEDVPTFLQDYKNLKFEYMAVNIYYFLKNREILEDLTKKFWTVQKTEDRFEEYMVLVREDSNIKSLKDLKNKTMLRRSTDYMGGLVLDAALLEATDSEAKGYISEFIESKNFSSAILKIYFKKADACIVPSYALDIVSELNPDVGKQLKVLYKTKRIFIPSIAGFHNVTDPEKIRRFSRNVLRLEQSARGQNILNLFKMKKIRSISKEELAPLFAYYNNYLSLKKNYLKEQN